MALSPELEAHLGQGVTTIARCWKVTRRDGVVHGFTDHDLDLVIDNLSYRADTGMTAQALSQTTGLSVDNTEALGVLNDASITEKDIRAGRYDGAEVEAWLVNWSDTSQRFLRFRGTVGELAREAGGFRAELNGLSEKLNQPQGRVYQMPCSAVLGDGACRFNLSQSGYQLELPVVDNTSETTFQFADMSLYPNRWFERGRFTVLTGAAKDLTGLIKNDRTGANGARTIELWESIRERMVSGDMVRLEAGCDKLPTTCRVKFNNFRNFRGFPDIPGEDWLMSYPVGHGKNDGGDARETNELPDWSVLGGDETNPFVPNSGD
ncbi:phage conserved hypothetical protein BR0599 [Aliiroseovarius sediminilitoris]|uniref:Bacteriophage phiJL001 Gp84 C-terminal domain-containing protein n=1 Tax=Aliiroseovarius sediminilitoris TaxID=1173584 RepID=A0A1I0Q110_9RHOB|nr:DUF2163 domain-containing protein [Aliiroseovarius sediminilitoris]SEW20603.1 phage conserved hypothetical protein BR0599 [Aliiroseovarius sediminilitoris]